MNGCVRKGSLMHLSLYTRSPRTARIFIVLILLLIACLYLGGRTAQYVSGFSSLVLTTYQHLAMSSDDSVLTFHNDTLRTGQNLNETLLNTSNVSAQRFGKRVSYPVDGKVYAQPLFVPDVLVKGHHSNVVYVATENDSVYAFAADPLHVVAPVWKTSFLHLPEVTTVPSTDVFG